MILRANPFLRSVLVFQSLHHCPLILLDPWGPFLQCHLGNQRIPQGRVFRFLLFDRLIQEDPECREDLECPMSKIRIS